MKEFHDWLLGGGSNLSYRQRRRVTWVGYFRADELGEEGRWAYMMSPMPWFLYGHFGLLKDLTAADAQNTLSKLFPKAKLTLFQDLKPPVVPDGMRHVPILARIDAPCVEFYPRGEQWAFSVCSQAGSFYEGVIPIDSEASARDVLAVVFPCSPIRRVSEAPSRIGPKETQTGDANLPGFISRNADS
jgi:hypothetical protein